MVKSLVMAACVAFTATIGQAAVLGFENAAATSSCDVDNPTTLGNGFTNPSDGATYSSGIMGPTFAPGCSLAVATPRSGQYYAMNFNSRVGMIANSAAFDLNSMWMHADSRIGNTSVTVQGLDAVGGNVLFTRTFLIGAAWNQYVFDWAGINVVSWDSISPNSSNIAIDDLEYNGGMAPVPLPPALPILALGLAGLGLLRRRKA